MDLKNNGKLNFVIDLFLSLDKFMSGGLVAMHKLAYELANRECNVYIFCTPGYPHENITVIPSTVEIVGGHRFNATWEGFNYFNKNTISIYPEHGSGNKFNTINNTRWIMYHIGPKEINWFNDNDYIFNFETFKTGPLKESGKLTVRDYNLDKFFTEDIDKNGYCFINGKETPKNYKEILTQYNPTDITFYKDQPDLNLLRKEFNKYKYFLTFDEKTYLTTAAALCGCEAIILNPNKDLTPLEYKLKNPLNMFGVAYGIDDLKWSGDTLHFVPNYIPQLKDIDQKTIENFIKFWKNKLNV